jgi:hypothetical protein
MMQAGPPDTSAYYHVAYVWVAAVYIGYSLLLWLRGRRVRERGAARRQAKGQA